MKLVIVESPTKAKTLGHILGKSYEVTASMGHVRDLPKSGLGVDLENDFAPVYEITEKAKKNISKIKDMAKDADSIILATDPDREGEAIAWHLKEILTGAKGRSKKKSSADDSKFSRVVFHELTDAAVKDAFAHPASLDLNLVDAQQARRVLDRLVGYKLSPLLWKKVRYGLSAGRVQSVAVRLVVERERERQAFVPDEYWTIEGEFISVSKHLVKANLFEFKGEKLEIKDEATSTKILKALDGQKFAIEDIKKTEKSRQPYAPFKTSTMQQAAANVYGMSASKTMQAAQKLFEEGYITYHRTDSLNLSDKFIADARGFIAKNFGANFLPDKANIYKTKSKNAQEAHEAIRVTNVSKIPGKIKGMAPELLKIYTLIWKRSLECQMLAAIYDQTTIFIKSANEYLFKASGSVIKFDGWLAVGKMIGLETEEDELFVLDTFEVGESLKLKTLTPSQHFTQPPARYSDATLIKALEEMGIGRPSTYAPTITTIQSRGYIAKDGRYFVPQDVAFVVNDLLVANFPDIVDFSFTAKMEDDLDEIANGALAWVPTIRNFYTPFAKNVDDKDHVLHKHDITNLGESGEKCPECGKPLIFKLGKFGKFLSCSDYPTCAYAKPLDMPEQQEDYGKCAVCNDGVMVLKQGRFGKFLACSNYPKCKTTQKYLEKIGMKCPKCTDGEVVIKKAKGRNFYGCSKYPDCDYSSWKNPLIAEKES